MHIVIACAAAMFASAINFGFNAASLSNDELINDACGVNRLQCEGAFITVGISGNVIYEVTDKPRVPGAPMLRVNRQRMGSLGAIINIALPNTPAWRDTEPKYRSQFDTFLDH